MPIKENLGIRRSGSPHAECGSRNDNFGLRPLFIVQQPFPGRIHHGRWETVGWRYGLRGLGRLPARLPVSKKAKAPEHYQGTDGDSIPEH